MAHNTDHETITGVGARDETNETQNACLGRVSFERSLTNKFHILNQVLYLKGGLKASFR